MRRNDFVFDLAKFMYQECHQIKYTRGGSYIDSPHWIKNKKSTINLKAKIINVLNMQQLLHYIIKKLSIIGKESQILNRL